uniref:Uncharacterized protein n=1 Tax=Arundo donax TaxID=35708 RepID=A0A0A9BN33_ARUDO
MGRYHVAFVALPEERQALVVSRDRTVTGSISLVKLQRGLGVMICSPISQSLVSP